MSVANGLVQLLFGGRQGRPGLVEDVHQLGAAAVHSAFFKARAQVFVAGKVTDRARIVRAHRARECLPGTGVVRMPTDGGPPPPLLSPKVANARAPLQTPNWPTDRPTLAYAALGVAHHPSGVMAG